MMGRMPRDPWDPIPPSVRADLERLVKQVTAFVSQNMPAIDAIVRRQANLDAAAQAITGTVARQLEGLTVASDVQEQWRRQIQAIFRDGPLIKAFIDQQRQVQQFLDRIIDPAVFDRFRRLLEEAEPPNWPEGRDRDVMALIDRTRWPLVWVPDVELITTLLDVENDSGLYEVVVTHADAILASCSSRLDELPDDFYPRIVTATRAAIAAFNASPMATQSLAATTFENVLRATLGYRSLCAATSDLSNAADWKSEPFRLLRWALIRSCMPNVLAEFWPDRGDPVPGQFNRHATVHTLDPAQYTATNAVVGVMLITSTMRELHQLTLDGILESDDDDPTTP
jgi:hypothetical protein